MAISPQLPQTVAALRPAALQALALQGGQVLEAQIIGPAPNGGTQVQLAGQVLSLVLPVALEAGTTIRLEVQATGAQIRLALSPHSVAAQPAPLMPLPAQPATLPLPQVQPSPTPSAVAPIATAAGPPSPDTPAGMVLVSRSAEAVEAQAPGPSRSIGQPAPATPAVIPIPAPERSAAPPVALLQVSAQGTVQAPATPAATLNTPQIPYAPAPPPQLTATTAPPPPGATPSALASVQAQLALPTTATLPPTASSIPTSPQAAVAQMVQSAAPRQDSIASLMTALSAVAGRIDVPEPVARAMGQVMAGQLAIDSGTLDGRGLKQAVLNSGVFQEANLARVQVTSVQPDQKSSLLLLRQELASWLGLPAVLPPAGQIAPPIRGQVPRARSTAAPPIEPVAEPQEIGKQLLERTESALSRLHLHQSASLPDPVAKAGVDWSMDLPVLVGSQQTVLHLQIHGEPEQQDPSPAERGWQMRFAISLPQLGEAGAQISLRAGTTGVMLWATDRQTSEALETHVMALRQTLADIGLRPGAVIVRHGEPLSPVTPSGHFVDART